MTESMRLTTTGSHRGVLRRLFPLLLAVLTLLAAAPAQERASELQRRAEAEFQQLQERMATLQVERAEADPSGAELLASGTRLAQERRIAARMTGVRNLLDAERYDQALEDMAGVRQDLEALLDLLLDRAMDVEELVAEIERLEAYQARVQELLTEQQAERRAAADLEQQKQGLEQQLDNIEAARAELEQLRDDQQALRKQAEQAGEESAPKAAEKMAERQDELRQRASNAEPKLRALQKKADELKGQKPAEAGESGKDGAATQACKSAASSMSKSGEKLQKNQPQRSLQDMDDAGGKLDQALQELDKLEEEARRELLSLPFGEQGDKQESTKVDTDKLAEDMEGDDQKAADEGKPQQTPGKRRVQQAVPKQKAAAGQLKERKPGDAKQDQQDAEEALRQAQKELEEALTQLRQQLQDQVLRALEERFAQMLEVQKGLSERTRAADRLAADTLTADGAVPQAVAARALQIADGEHGLSGEAGDALKLLQEDGSTAAFPAVIEMLRDDFTAVARRLEAARVGRGTQLLQAEIEQTLKDLIDALRKQIEDNEGGGNASCNGQPVLVPRSAELKLVMIKQKRVNSRTQDFDQQIPEQLRVTEEAQDEARVLSQQQSMVEQLLRRMAVRLQKDEEGRGQ